MRYIIETTSKGNDESVWNTINSLKDKELIRVVEKGDPVEEMKGKLRRIARAVETLKKSGVSEHVMKSYIYANVHSVKKTDIDKVLAGQESFFRKMGLKV